MRIPNLISWLRTKKHEPDYTMATLEKERKDFLNSVGIKTGKLPHDVRPLDYDPGPGNTAFIYQDGIMYEIQGKPKDQYERAIDPFLDD